MVPLIPDLPVVGVAVKVRVEGVAAAVVGVVCPVEVCCTAWRLGREMEG